MKFYFLLGLVSLSALAEEERGHIAKDPLLITYYSSSVVQDELHSRCEGGNKGTAYGFNFDKYAVTKEELLANGPKMVAMLPIHNAARCTLKFLDGPFAGKSALVGDQNGNDTIDIALDTSSAKSLMACKYMVDHAPQSGAVKVHYMLTGSCPGARGTGGPSVRKEGAAN